MKKKRPSNIWDSKIIIVSGLIALVLIFFIVSDPVGAFNMNYERYDRNRNINSNFHFVGSEGQYVCRQMKFSHGSDILYNGNVCNNVNVMSYPDGSIAVTYRNNSDPEEFFAASWDNVVIAQNMGMYTDHLKRYNDFLDPRMFFIYSVESDWIKSGTYVSAAYSSYRFNVPLSDLSLFGCMNWIENSCETGWIQLNGVTVSTQGNYYMFGSSDQRAFEAYAVGRISFPAEIPDILIRRIDITPQVAHVNESIAFFIEWELREYHTSSISLSITYGDGMQSYTQWNSCAHYMPPEDCPGPGSPYIEPGIQNTTLMKSYTATGIYTLTFMLDTVDGDSDYSNNNATAIVQIVP